MTRYPSQRTLLLSIPSPPSLAALAALTLGLAALALGLVATTARAAEPAPGRAGAPPALLTDPSLVFSVPQVPKPAYLTPFTDPTFASPVMRVGSNIGATTAPVSGLWGSDARHVYSKQQPWSSDQSMIIIENRSGGSPTPLILDGTTYLPKLAPCPSSPLYDYRWHPASAHAHELVNVNSSGNELEWYDVTTCTTTRTWTLPITVDYGIGSGEGNPSNDGRFVALGNNNAMFVVDMDPQPPYAPYPNKRIGPVYTFPPCSLTAGAPNTWVINSVAMSPSGKYVDISFDSGNDTTYDANRIYDVDPATLALKPHNMASSSLRCGSFQYRPNGWIFPLKHADMALDPFDNDEDVILGGRSCPGSNIGRVVKVRLRDGQVTPLTDSSNESDIYHVSTRNIGRPGWVYVSYYKESGKRFSDEIIAVKLDGSGAVERLTHMHTAASGCYRCEAHPVPSPDGMRVIFASNWAQDCTACGSASDIKDYVVSLTGVTGIPGPAPSAGVDLALERVIPNPARALPAVHYSLASWAPASLRLIDVAGRLVFARDLGSPGPGRHETRLGDGTAPPPGTYWLSLQQSGRNVTSKVTFVH